MNTKSIIEIFRGDDSDALGYQTIVGTIHTDLDLAGCKAVFRYLGFFQEFDPIPEDGKLTIVIPSASSIQFPPGLGYASLKVYDIDRKVRTFTNRIPVFVSTKTPCRCGGEFDVEFSPFPELEPLKIFVGPNAEDFDQYTGFVSKIIDRASLVKYGLAILADAMSEDGGASGKAASPLAVKAAYDAIIKELTDNYYTAEETDEAINSVAAYYITYDAAGNPFPTYAALANATTVYSGGKVRIPTRNDYCVVLADETHQGAEYRYIYAVAEGQTTGSWQPQFPVEGVMTVDQTVTKNSANPVTSGGIWSAIWGALAALPTGFTSLYDWCVAQLAGKLDKSGGRMTGDLDIDGGTDHGRIILYVDGVDGGQVSLLDRLGHKAQIYPTRIRIEPAGGQFYSVELPASAGTIALLENIATAFSTSSTYEVNKLCVYHNALYRCTTEITTAGAWDSSKWTAVTVEDVLELIAYQVSLKASAATVRAALALKAPLASPAFTGAPTAPTPASGDDSTKVATTAFVQGALPYAISESTPLTVTSGAASTTLDDRTHNVRTVAAPGTGNTTTITATMPPIVAGKSRDMFLNLTVGTQASDAGDISLSIVEPSGATAQIDIGSVEDIGIGKNEILISENALPTTSGNVTTTHWLVTVRHEDFAS